MGLFELFAGVVSVIWILVAHVLCFGRIPGLDQVELPCDDPQALLHTLTLWYYIKLH